MPATAVRDDAFDRLPWLCPPERWHPGAEALIGEAKSLHDRLPGDDGLELWAQLGSLTQADPDRRERVVSELSELMRLEGTEPGWPVVARCLVRLASAELPGRYLAALALLELVTVARERGAHATLLPVDDLELALGRWNDPRLSPFRDAIRRRVLHEARASSYAELMRFDAFIQLACDSERER